MLAMHTQNGDTCIAYALWNVGAVGESAVRDYEERAENAKPYEGAYASFGMFQNAEEQRRNNAEQVGGFEFVKPWLLKYRPEFLHTMEKEYATMGLASLIGIAPQVSIPPNGKGLLFLLLNGAYGHVVAYENGNVFDSSNNDSERYAIETLEAWKHNYIQIGWTSVIITGFMDTEKELEYAATLDR